MTLRETRVEALRAKNPLASKSNAANTNNKICSHDLPKEGENGISINETLVTTGNSQRTTNSGQRTNLDIDYPCINVAEDSLPKEGWASSGLKWVV